MAPRDGSGNYTLPFPAVVTNTTISSAVENGTDADIAQDLNSARPIVAGGTGASTASQALFNLSGEKAAQNVANWDSTAWLPGSFYAATSATGTAPVAAHAFAGICYLNEPLANPPTNQNLVTQATDLTDSANTQYIRVMTAGVWSQWTKIGVASAAGTLGEYTFDTGTSFPPASGTIRFNNATQNSTTEIFISHLTATGADVTTSFPLFKAGNDISIQDKATPASYKIFTATAGPVMSGGDCRILVTAKIAGLDIAAAKRVIVNVPGGPAVRYDAPQGLTDLQQAQARANINITKKNYILNGAMMISQENGGTAGALPGAATYYPADTYYCTVNTSAGGITAAQVASLTPGGSPNRIRLTVTATDTSIAAGELVQIIHNIEGLRAADLKSGTASAKTATLQFGCKGPAGTYCVSFVNNAANRSYVADFVIAAGEANTDVVKTVTVPLDISGTWAVDNTIGITLRWFLMGGTTYQTAPNVWTAGAFYCSPNISNFMGTGGNVFELFDVSLTEGNVAPPFQVPNYASELAACQRYWYTTNPEAPKGSTSGSVAFWAYSTTAANGYAKWAVRMRAVPTITLWLNGTANTVKRSTDGAAIGVTPSFFGVNSSSVSILSIGAANFAVSVPYEFDLQANARL